MGKITTLTCFMLVLAPAVILAAPAAPVSVALIDTPVDTDHAMFAAAPGRTPVLVDTERRMTELLTRAAGCSPGRHGTRMAAVLRARAPSARIAPIPVSGCPGDPLTPERAAQALTRAVEGGHPVITMSMTYSPVVAAATGRWPGLARLDRQDTALLVAAGNGLTDLSRPPGREVWQPGAPLVDQSVFVGVWRPGGLRAGAFPGANPVLQSRFLLAPDGERIVVPGMAFRTTGSSPATARVAAAVAVLLDRFPGLSPTAALDRLLATASRDGLPGYGRTECGPSGTVDCGRHRFGQGRLDLEAAIASLAAGPPYALGDRR